MTDPASFLVCEVDCDACRPTYHQSPTSSVWDEASQRCGHHLYECADREAELKDRDAFKSNARVC